MNQNLFELIKFLISRNIKLAEGNRTAGLVHVRGGAKIFLDGKGNTHEVIL